MTTPPNQPIDWFPGVHTGPRVAIAVTADEIDQLRRMLDRLDSEHAYDGRQVIADLEVRLGASQELQALVVQAPLQFTEFETLRYAFREISRWPSSITGYDEISALFTELHKRLGAAQIRRAGSGEMTADEIGHRADLPFEGAEMVDDGIFNPRDAWRRPSEKTQPRFRFGGLNQKRDHP